MIIEYDEAVQAVIASDLYLEHVSGYRELFEISISLNTGVIRYLYNAPEYPHAVDGTIHGLATAQ